MVGCNMIEIYTQKEFDKLKDKNGNVHVDDRLIIHCNINACHIKAWDINACNINACNIKAWDIKVGNIKAWDIKACNINACNINACNINTCNINAGDINAGDIVYYALCVAYSSFKCISVSGTRDNSKHFCLDQDIEYLTKKEV